MPTYAQIADTAIWLAYWTLAYFALGATFGWTGILMKWHFATMREYVERQYDYGMRISQQEGIPQALIDEYRKETRRCANFERRLKEDLPRLPFRHWMLRWPGEIAACLKLERSLSRVKNRIRKWDETIVR